MKLEISLELAGKLAGKKPEEIKADLFQGDGEDVSLKDGAEETFRNLVYDKFKEAERDKVKSEVGKAVKNRMLTLESVINPVLSKYEIEADNLEDGLKMLSEKIPGKPPKDGKPQELTSDQIKKLPAYQELLDSEISIQKKAAAEWEQKYSDYVKQTESKKIVSIAREKALSVLDNKGAVWGADKSNQLDYFFKAIGTDKFKVGEDEKSIELVDADGNPLRDEARNRITYDDFILREWKNAGYALSEAPAGSSSAGAQRNGGNGQGSGGSKIVINSPQHYEELMKSETDFSKRSEIRKAWIENLTKNK